MPLSMGQMAGDLDAGMCGKCRVCRKAQRPRAADAPTVEAVEHLVESVRRIRAVTDEVLDARVRIDEVLQSAKDLSACVAQSPQQ
ncbi:hypothetical protein H4R21_002329 [Coemansia helicoidea]|uniref:Uncharacterized protein n=1 Tax=Coemansia helicoidea TaxID=1286919 RepID=A0ACC1L7X6_9FUNG|nr:hypothetical protein H4R21_002329 [Coemansia helicoidea]